MNFVSGNLVTLLDGSQVDSATEAWRHECEARHILNMPTRDKRRAFLDSIGTKRGQAAMQALEATITAVSKAQRQGAKQP